MRPTSASPTPPGTSVGLVESAATSCASSSATSLTRALRRSRARSAGSAAAPAAAVSRRRRCGPAVARRPPARALTTGWETTVSGGFTSVVQSRSSKPTSASSCGIESSSSVAAWSTPWVMKLLAVNTAVGRSGRSSSCRAAARASAWVEPPIATSSSDTSPPPRRSARRYPAMRSADDEISAVSDTIPMRRCPSPSRCATARSAPGRVLDHHRVGGQSPHRPVELHHRQPRRHDLIELAHRAREPPPGRPHGVTAMHPERAPRVRDSRRRWPEARCSRGRRRRR